MSSCIRKRWRPRSDDGLELDQYDTSEATYLLGIEDGHVVTGARLLPTSEPHLVSEIFPHLCEATGVIRRPDVGEWTRTYVYGDAADRGLRGTLTQLCCAVMEFALDEGLAAVGGIQETYFMPHHARLRWKARPCGLAREVNGEWYIVAYIDVTEAALHNVRKLLGITHPLLVRRGSADPVRQGSRPRRRRWPMHEHAGGHGEGAKVQYIADVLKELRRLSNPYELLSYLIEMAEVEAAKTAKHRATSSAGQCDFRIRSISTRTERAMILFFDTCSI
jgi:acyl-homoserine lactone synthase